MTIRLQRKRAEEVVNFLHDWTPFLGADTIASEVTTAVGVTVSGVSIQAGDQSVRFEISGGTDGTVGIITQTITTAGGLTETETFSIAVGADEPISLAEAKAQVRVLDTSEDAYIETLISAARRYVENRSGVIVLQRQFVERHRPEIRAFRGLFGSGIRLYNGPIVSVDSIAYVDAAGADATYTTARVLPGSPQIYPALGESWPKPYMNESFTITYTAGLSPEQLGTDDYANLLHAMKLLIGHWFTNREAVVVDRAQALSVPLAVEDLCDQVRALVV